MEWVQTRLGRVPVWGDFRGGRRLVLAIRGACPEMDHLADLDPPDCDLALLHLPGFHSPTLQVTSIGAFVRAFDEVIGHLFRGRDITALGVSTGALVALGLKAPEVRRVLAVEPFFSTAKLWPLVEFFARELRENPNPALHHWADAVFGYRLDGVTDRDYRHLAASGRPVIAVVGSEPLMPRRPVRGLPSMSDEEDRSKMTCRVVPGGHDVAASDIRMALVDLHEQHG